MIFHNKTADDQFEKYEILIINTSNKAVQSVILSEISDAFSYLAGANFRDVKNFIIFNTTKDDKVLFTISTFIKHEARHKGVKLSNSLFSDLTSQINCPYFDETIIIGFVGVKPINEKDYEHSMDQKTVG
jgi:hypothetical protein